MVSFLIVLDMSYVVYIIFSAKLNKYYIGHTENIEKRINDHNSGISAFTSKASDWEIKYTEPFSSREDALHREKTIKKKKSRKYLEWLIGSAR